MTENTSPRVDDEAAARRLAEAFAPGTIDALLKDAKSAGTPIDGVDGLLNQITKAVLERALQAEMTDHLGYDAGDPAGRGTGNSRNGKTTKTVSTRNGPVDIEVPRDIEAHLREVYDVNASRELISNVTDVVVDEMKAWQSRPLDRNARMESGIEHTRQPLSRAPSFLIE